MNIAQFNPGFMGSGHLLINIINHFRILFGRTPEDFSKSHPYFLYCHSFRFLQSLLLHSPRNKFFQTILPLVLFPAIINPDSFLRIMYICRFKTYQ
jgi:hypothetical protein